MSNDRTPLSKPDAYWERAGEVSYAKAMFTSNQVEQHVNLRLWNTALEIADQIGVPHEGRVLDLGCGDGAFANQMLAGRYRVVEGYDKAEAAIERAKTTSAGRHMKFVAADLISMDYGALQKYDGVFLIGFLHHVKAATPKIVKALRGVTDRVIVLEPNGNHLLRKFLEFTPTYRSAGEDSFRTRQLMDIFAQAGYQTAAWRRMNLFPNFTPGAIYRALGPLEPKIEASSFWNALCTVNMFGFTGRVS